MISMLFLVLRVWGCGVFIDIIVGVIKEIVIFIKCVISVGGLVFGYDIVVRVMDEVRVDISVNFVYISGFYFGMVNDFVLWV